MHSSEFGSEFGDPVPYDQSFEGAQPLDDQSPFGSDGMMDSNIIPPDPAEDTSEGARLVFEDSPFVLTAAEKALLDAHARPEGEEISRTLNVAPDLPTDARLLVDMNQNMAATVSVEKHVTMLTGYLNGCTATSAVAVLADGSSRVVLAHIDLWHDKTLSDAGGNNLSRSLLDQFRADVEAQGDVQSVRILVAHGEEAKFYNMRHMPAGKYNEWHVLDQLRHGVEQWQESTDVTAVFLPYPSDYTGHNVAVDIKDGQVAFYYDGIPVPGFEGG
jgi:hypothetical protein